jgi:hypothetical protein
MTTKDCLELILEPMAESFSTDFARKLVELRAPDVLQDRVDQLATKANEGTLTEAEEGEYRDYIDTANVLAIIQSKARRFLQQHAG